MQPTKKTEIWTGTKFLWIYPLNFFVRTKTVWSYTFSWVWLLLSYCLIDKFHAMVMGGQRMNWFWNDGKNIVISFNEAFGVLFKWCLDQDIMLSIFAISCNRDWSIFQKLWIAHYQGTIATLGAYIGTLRILRDLTVS